MMFIGKQRGGKNSRGSNRLYPSRSSTSPASSEKDYNPDDDHDVADLQHTPPEYKRTSRSSSKTRLPWKEHSRKTSNYSNYQPTSNDRKKYTPPSRPITKDSQYISHRPQLMTSEEELEKLKKRQARFATSPAPNKYNYGLISRGEDNSLQNDEQAQQEFFSYIVAQFINYCDLNASSKLHDEITKVISDEDIKSSESIERQPDKATSTIDSILISIRKLREALLYSKPNEFSKKVFLFSVRISAIIGEFRTYIPSISYLLRNHKQLELSQVELEEIVTLLVLHHVHKTEDHCAAVKLYFQYIPQKIMIHKIIQCWIRNDYYGWFKLYDSQSDNCIIAIMQLGLDKMIHRFISTYSMAYFTIAKQDLEHSLPRGILYDDLVNKYGVKWKLNDHTVVIRDRSKRK